jgi:Flp pilus assembly pilin Flp
MADSLPIAIAVLLSGLVLLELSIDKKWEALTTALSGTSVVLALYGVTK